jgi:autophagy-related protein 2
LLEVYLNKMQFQHETYPSGCRESSRQVLVVPSFEVRDRHVLSNINKLLHLYANMLSVKCVQVRPDLKQPDALETSLSVSAMPIRLNIDQDTLFFIIDFASSLTSSAAAEQKAVAAEMTTATTTQRVRYNHGMAVVEVQEEEEEEVEESKEVFESALENPQEVEEEGEEEEEVRPKPPKKPKRKRKAPDVFIRSFTFGPDVPIRIDYSAKYLDLTQGALTGLLAGMASLNGSELTLKSASYHSGILGFERLLTQLVTSWLADIRQNQIPSLLGGVGPMFSVLQLFQGIKDLILLPLEQYQKDGRLMKGLQKGANRGAIHQLLNIILNLNS